MLISSKNRQIACTDENSKSSSLSLSSSSVVASNFDILRQILLCLPVKSLLVFKSVSKQWLSLISDSSFIKDHFFQNYLSTHALLLCRRALSDINPHEYEFVFPDGKKITNDDVPFKTLTFIENPPNLSIEQTCNGLLCCSCFTDEDCEQRDFYIYNPATKHYKTLPISQLEANHQFLCVCSVSLAFDPLKSPYYEAICVWAIEIHEFKIAIYSSETDSWRVSRDTISEELFDSGVFWNGSLHWLDICRKLLVYFDIGKEVISNTTIPSLPDDYEQCQRIRYFEECKGHLHLVITYQPIPTIFDILEMETNYTGWNIKYRVNLEGLLVAYPEIVQDRFQFSVLLVDEEEEESSKLAIEILNNGDIISYDLTGLSFKKIHNLPPNEVFERNGCFHYPYTETLACV